MIFVALEGWATDAGPVLGAVITESGGPLMVFDLEKRYVRPVDEEEQLTNQRDEAQQTAQRREAPSKYVMLNNSGQPGRVHYNTPAEAAMVAKGRSFAAIQGGELRALTQEEHAYIDEFLANLGGTLDATNTDATWSRGSIT